MKLIIENFRRYQRFVEAAYEGNIGAEEVMKFYMNAPDDKVAEFEQAVDVEDNTRAWDIVQNYLGVDLVGIGSSPADDPITEGEVAFSGILKTMPTEAMGELQKLSQALPEGAVLLPEDKWHVTLVHQSVLKPYRKELKSMEFPPAPVAKLIPEVEERSDGEKRSWVVWLENQEEMKGYVNQLMQQLGGQSDPEPDRRFHVSLANLTGKPGDSVR